LAAGSDLRQGEDGGDAVTIRVPPPSHFIARPRYFPPAGAWPQPPKELEPRVLAFAISKRLSEA
jgi:hypothetical protein